MDQLFATTGMSIATGTILVMYALSLIVMIALLYEFAHIHTKRMEMLQALDCGTRIRKEMIGRHITMIVYVVMTLLITIVSAFLFVFQPHLL